MKRFIQSWLINTCAVLVAAYLIKGIHYEKPLDLFVASLLLGIFNAVLRPLLTLLALPLVIFTLGLFRLVINAVLLYFVGYVMHPRFYVDGFGDAFWGALVISLVSVLFHILTGTGNSHVSFQRRGRPPNSDQGGGPVIDI